MILITARKTIFSFSWCSEKMVFPKKLHWNMIFLELTGKMIFLFPENMILFSRRKRKDDLSQKNTWKYDVFYKCSENHLFRTFEENIIFRVFFWERPSFLFRLKKDDLSQTIHGNVTNMILPFCQKSKR